MFSGNGLSVGEDLAELSCDFCCVGLDRAFRQDFSIRCSSGRVAYSTREPTDLMSIYPFDQGWYKSYDSVSVGSCKQVDEWHQSHQIPKMQGWSSWIDSAIRCDWS